MAKEVYRKSLLEKLSSPEQLDRMITIISPTFWLAAAGGGLILAVALVWSIVGRLPVNVTSNGIYMTRSGIHAVHAETGGTVEEALAADGMFVSKGQALVQLDTRQIRERIVNIEARKQSVAVVTFDSEEDTASADNKSLLDMKAQKLTASAQLISNQALLRQRQADLKEQDAKTANAKRKYEQAQEEYFSSIGASDTSATQVEYQSAQSELNSSRQYLESAKTSLSQARSGETPLITQKAKLEADLAAARQALALAEEAAEAAREEMLDAEREQQAAQTALSKAQTELSSAQSEQSTAFSEKASAEAQLSSAKMELDSAEMQVSSSEITRDDQIDALRAQISHIENTIKQYDEQIDNLEMQINKIQYRSENGIEKGEAELFTGAATDETVFLSGVRRNDDAALFDETNISEEVGDAHLADGADSGAGINDGADSGAALNDGADSGAGANDGTDSGAGANDGADSGAGATYSSGASLASASSYEANLALEQELVSAIQSLTINRNSARIQLEQLQNQLASLSSNADIAQDAVRNAEEHIRTAEEKVNDTTARYERAEAKVNDAKEEYNRLSAAVSKCASAYSEKSVAYQEANTQVSIERGKVSTLESQLDSVRSQIDSVNANVGTAEYSFSDWEERVSAAQARYQEAERRYIDAMRESARQQAQSSKQSAMYNEAMNRYTTELNAGRSLNDSIIQLMAQIGAEESNLNVQNAALETQFDTAKASILEQIDRELDDAYKQLDNCTVRSTLDGVIYGFNVVEGGILQQTAVVCKVAPVDVEDDDVLISYAPMDIGRKITPGMRVVVYPSTVNRQEYGHMEATVMQVADYVTSVEDMRNQLGDDSLVQAFSQSGPVIAVTCELRRDETTVSGYWWSNRKGAKVELLEGTLVSMDVITEEKAPITMLIPLLKEKLTIRQGDSAANQSNGQR